MCSQECLAIALDPQPELRELSRTPPNQRSKHVGVLPYTYLQGDTPFAKSYREATASLTVGECAELARGEHVAIHTSAGYNSMYLKPDDDDGWMPKRSNLYGLFLLRPTTTQDGTVRETAADNEIGHLNIDPFRPNFLSSPLAPDFPKGQPDVDLTPYFVDAVATHDQKLDLDFTLVALAKASHIDLYRESFIEAPANRALAPLRGSIDTLAMIISVQWACAFVHSDHAYYVWDRQWAFNRAADISDVDLARWKERAEVVPDPTPADHIAVVTEFTWPQVALTFRTAVPGWFQFEDNRWYRSWWLYASLSPAEFKQASSVAGLRLGDVNSSIERTFAVYFRRELEDIPQEENQNIVLKANTRQFDGGKTDRRQTILINGSLDGSQVTQAHVFYDIPNPATKTAIAR